MEVSKNLPNRHEIAKTIKELGKDLDILVRKSDGRGPFNIPFMKWVAKATGNEMTHAAILLKNSDISNTWDLVAELSDTGFSVYRVVDWLNFCIDGQYQLYRVHMDEAQSRSTYNAVYKFCSEDPEYDKTFSTGWYCTKFVCKMFEAAGIELQKPKTIRELCGWLTGHRISIINKLVVWWTKGEYGLPVDVPLYFLGNVNNGGMLSYPGLERIV